LRIVGWECASGRASGYDELAGAGRRRAVIIAGIHGDADVLCVAGTARKVGEGSGFTQAFGGRTSRVLAGAGKITGGHNGQPKTGEESLRAVQQRAQHRCSSSIAVGLRILRVPLTDCLFIALADALSDALARNASLFTVAALVTSGFLDLERHRCRGSAGAALVDVKGGEGTGRFERLQLRGVEWQ
jgi:hypothetical protein